MPLPLALLPWMPAIAAGTGTAIKGAQRYGPQIVQGGLNTLNRVGSSPFMQNLVNRFQYGYDPAAKGINKALNYPQNLFWTPGGLQPSNPIAYERGYQDVIEDAQSVPEIASDIKGFVVDLFKSEKTKEKEKKEENKKKRTESRKKQRIKKKKKEEPSLDLVEMKKGGYVKKQRKRKHYKAKGFVKMKKSKKRKYIQEKIMGIFKTYKAGKEAIETAKKANIEKMQENANKIKKMVEGLDKSQLKLLKEKTGDIFKESPSKIGKWIKGILGLGTAGATIKGAYEVGQETMRKAKGGYVKMKKGGSVKKSSSKKSRGTGAAKRGTKFKGVFQWLQQNKDQKA